MGCNSRKPMTDHTRALSAEMRLVATFWTIPKVPQESRTRIENQSQGACMGYKDRITIAATANTIPIDWRMVIRSRRNRTASTTVNIGYKEVAVVTTAVFDPPRYAA